MAHQQLSRRRCSPRLHSAVGVRWASSCGPAIRAGWSLSGRCGLGQATEECRAGMTGDKGKHPHLGTGPHGESVAWLGPQQPVHRQAVGRR